MYSISSAFADELANDNRAYLIRLDFTFVDGFQLSINNSGIWQGGLCFEDAVSGDSDFQVGSAIINKLNITLDNINDQFSSYVFEGAVVVAYVGLNLSGGTTEMVKRGTYIVDSVKGQNASLIKLECLDYMTKFDVPYSDVNTPYPASLGTIVRDICTYCAVSLQTAAFDGSSFVVSNRPNNDGLTCRQVLAYAAQIACAFARMNENGGLELLWYRVGENIDPEHDFRSIYNISTSQYTVAVTGVRVTEEFDETDTLKKDTEMWGTEGYVIDISGNELIQSGTAETVAQMIGQKLVGVMSFKTVDATITSDPSVEAGDTAVIVDEKGNSAFFPITRVTFSTDGNMSVSCSAKTPVRQAATIFNQLTRALIRANNYTSVRLSDYDRATLELSRLMSETFGVFMTEVVQQDGSVIRIQHNKPLLEDSDIQWKMTAGALAVSTDYGETWNAGIDAQGNAVVNVLNAIGVNADWIRTGSLSVSDHDTIVFRADLDTGSVYLSGDYVYIGDKTATEALNELAGALVITLSNEMQGIPVDSDGHYDTFPNVDTTIRVFYGSEDVTASVTLTDNALGVTGNLVYNSVMRTYVYHATSLTADTGYVAFTATYASQAGTMTNSKRFNLYKAYAGKDGPAGTAVLYMLEPNVDIVKRGADDVCTPGTVTFYAYYRDGDSATRYPYSGLIEIYVMRTDSSEWELVIPATENKTSESYAIASSDIGNVKAVLRSQAEYNDVYWGLTDDDGSDPPVALVDSDDALFCADHTIEIISGGETVDIATVPVLKDIENLTQDKVFDIITNGGQLDGLWYENGVVYFNASYIGAGVIRSKDGSTYWDLDTGTMVITPSARVGSASGERISDMQARITTTAEGLQTEVTNRTNADTGLSSRITQNANNITTEVNDRRSADSGLSTRIIQNTNSITAEVTNRTNADNALSARITVNATAIESRVTSSDVESIIEQNADSIRLKANQIVWDATNSSMTKNGTLTAQNGSFKGTISASTITGSSIRNDNTTSYALLKDGTLDIYRNISGLTNIRALRLSVADGVALTGLNGLELESDDANAIPRLYSSNDFDIGTVQSQAALYAASALHAFRVGNTKVAYISSTDTYLHGYLTVEKNAYIDNNLYVNGVRTYGTKARTVKTEDYGKRLLYCYETPAPLFGDVGDGVINEDGLCYVQIDPTFLETVQTLQYQVFLQAYGEGKCYVKERKSSHFVVAGDPGLEFGWEMKARQIDFAQLRLERDDPDLEFDDTDYADEFSEHIKEVTINYGAIAEMHIEDVNKERARI